MGYITLVGGTSFVNNSYTIRGFTPDSIDTTVTPLDIEYHSSTYLGSATLGATASMPEVFRENWTGAGGLTQAQLDGGATAVLSYPGSAYQQTTLDLLNQANLEGGLYTTQDIDGTYNPGLNITGIGTTQITTESKVLVDNLLAAPFDGAGTYFIQMPVWGFPSSSTADLANCYITFSSSETYEPSQTLTIPFNSGSVLTGTATIAAGGNFIWKINRDFLVSSGVDISNLKKVKIGMKALTGTFDFKTESLKLVPADYMHYKVGVNTKLGRIKQERWPGTTQPEMPALIQDSFEASNFTHIVKFNSGNASGTANPNEFSLFYRVDPDRVANPSSYIRIRVVSDNTQVKIEGYEGLTLRYSQVEPPLSVNKEHILICYLDNDKIRTEIWESKASRLETLKLDTKARTISITNAGYVGFEFKPYYGNFYIDYMYAKDLAVAEYVSEIFESYTPVEGVSLYPQNSSYSNLIDSTFEESLAIDNLVKNISDSGQHNGNLTEVVPGINDVYITTDTTTTLNGSSFKATKHLKNAYIASMIYPDPFVVNDLSFITVSGYLRYESALEATKKSDGSDGSFRIVLWDKWFQKPVYIGEIQDVASNKWNYFEMPIIADIYNNELNFEIQHCGTADVNSTASFWFEDVEIKHRSIVWEASNNGGNTWIKFYDNLEDPYKAIHFPNDVYDHIVLNNNPKIYWKLNEKVGPVIEDSSGNSNKGGYGGTANITFNIAGTEIIKTDPKNTAIKLVNGGSAYIPSPIGLGTSAVSVNTWFRTGTAIAQNLVVQSGTATGTWKLQTTNDGIKFDIYNSGTVILTASAQVNYYDDVAPVGILPGTPKWHNVTATYDKKYLNLYFDGQLKASVQGTVPILGSAQIYFDGPSTGYRYQDEVQVYPTALSEREVVRLYNAGISTYNKLKVRAKAYTLDSWIGGYQLIPYYAKPGKYLETPNWIISANSIDEPDNAINIPTVTFKATISQGTANSIASAQSISNPDVYKKQIYALSVDSQEFVEYPIVTNVAATPAFRSVATQTFFTGTAYPLATPLGATNGDILIAVIGARDETSVIPTINWPAGWNVMENVDYEGSPNSNMGVAWRVYNSGSALGTATVAAEATFTSFAVAAYSGGTGVYTNSTPVYAEGTAWTPNSIISSQPNTRVVMAGFIYIGEVVTQASGFTVRAHNTNTMISDKAQAGTGIINATWTASGVLSWNGILIGIR